MKKVVLVTILTGLFFFGCKKYPEGPSFTLLTKKNRVTRFGNLDKYIVNGIDSTAYLPAYAINAATSDTIYFSVLDYVFMGEKKGNKYGLSTQSFGGDWGFNSDKTALSIAISGAYGYKFKNIFLNDNDGEWEIVKLTKKEMKLKAIYLNNVVELCFKPT